MKANLEIHAILVTLLKEGVDIVVISDTHMNPHEPQSHVNGAVDIGGCQGRTGSIHHRVPAGCRDTILVSVFE